MNKDQEQKYREEFEKERREWYKLPGQFERFFEMDSMGHYKDHAIENVFIGYISGRKAAQVEIDLKNDAMSIMSEKIFELKKENKKLDQRIFNAQLSVKAFAMTVDQDDKAIKRLEKENMEYKKHFAVKDVEIAHCHNHHETISELRQRLKSLENQNSKYSEMIHHQAQAEAYLGIQNEELKQLVVSACEIMLDANTVQFDVDERGKPFIKWKAWLESAKKWVGK